MAKYLDSHSINIIQQPNGKRLKIGGYRPSPHDPKPKKYKVQRFTQKELPPRVDLRRYMTEVEDQGEVGSCTANSMAGAYEYLAMRTLGQSGHVSRLFIYYNARLLDNSTKEDNGTTLQHCIKSLQEWGTCPEALWPYDPEQVFTEPNDLAYNAAANFLTKEAEQVEVGLYAMKHCLAEGYPFAFGLPLFDSFFREGNKGIPMPNPAKEKNLGGHAMLCVGYSDPYQVFVVRNSWGTDWGDRGYCYIPYNYLANPDYNDGDCWVIRSVTDLDFSADVWFEEGSIYDWYDGGEEDEDPKREED